MRVIYKLNDDICVGKTYIENDTSVLFDSEALRTEELGLLCHWEIICGL